MLILTFEAFILRSMESQLKTQVIVSLEQKELEPYRTLRRPMEHLQKGIFVAEGEKVVRRLLETDLSVVSMLLTPEFLEDLSQTTNLKSRVNDNSTIFIGEQKLLETIVGYNLHQGIMAVAKMPQERTLGETIQSLLKPYLLVALDGLVNSENVGVIVRNCAAFGIQAIIVGETSSSPYLRRSVRNSMGTVFQIPVVHEKDLANTLNMLHNKFQTRIIAADEKGSININNADLSGNVCIVLGNEDTGISAEVLAQCDERVSIPMKNGTDSLNVANASAVFLYEASKQR